MSRPGFPSSVLMLFIGTAVFGNGTAIGSDIATTSQTGARAVDTNPYPGTTPSGPPPSPYGSGLVLEPPPPPGVPATPLLDRTDAAATAAAVLAAYRNRDLDGLAALSTAENSDMMREIAQRGAAHPRYGSIFSGWRWKSVRDWSGQTGEVRYVNYPGGKVLPPRSMAWVAFAEVEGSDEIIVVALRRVDGRWDFDDIQSPSKADFARADRSPAAAAAGPVAGPFSTPEATVHSFFQGASGKDAGLMRKAIASTATGELMEIKRLSAGDPALDDLKAAFGNARVTGSERSRDPDRATVHIIFMRGGGETAEQMEMVREDGEWKIQDF